MCNNNECDECILKYADKTYCKSCKKKIYDPNDIACYECALVNKCPCNWSRNCAACLTIRHK